MTIIETAGSSLPTKRNTTVEGTGKIIMEDGKLKLAVPIKSAAASNRLTPHLKVDSSQAKSEKPSKKSHNDKSKVQTNTND